MSDFAVILSGAVCLIYAETKGDWNIDMLLMHSRAVPSSMASLSGREVLPVNCTGRCWPAPPSLSRTPSCET